eukprot:4394349-Lingulodinium_polyedra.AAC.1
MLGGPSEVQSLHQIVDVAPRHVAGLAATCQYVDARSDPRGQGGPHLKGPGGDVLLQEECQEPLR